MKLSKKFRGIKNLIFANLFGFKYPLHAELRFTNRCNQNCIYCECNSRSKKEMTTEQIFRFIDQIGNDSFHLTLTGGEPLLREDIGKIISYIKTKDIILSLTTNGTFVPDKIKQIKKVDYLILTLDGPKNVHDMQRGEGSYNRVIEAAKMARLEGITVEFLTVLTKDNLDHIDFILDKAKELGCSNVFQPVTKYCLSGDITDSVIPSPDTMRKTINYLIERKKDSKINNSYTALNYYLNWPNKKRIKCWAGKLFFALSDEGFIEPCCAITLSDSTKCTDKGFGHAFANITSFDCNGCWIAANIDFNLIFSLNREAFSNMFRFLNLRKK